MASKAKLIQRLISRQESLLKYHDITVRELNNRLNKYREVIETMSSDIMSIKASLEAEGCNILTRDEIDPRELEIVFTHNLFSWLFSEIVCKSEMNPDVVANDMLDLLKASYYPLILEPMIHYDYGYEIPPDFYRSRPSDFAEFIRSGRELLRTFLSEVGTDFLNSSKHWDEYSRRVNSWMVNHGLPTLYGIADEEWQSSEPLPRDAYYSLPSVKDKEYLVTLETYIKKYRGIVETDFEVISEKL